MAGITLTQALANLAAANAALTTAYASASYSIASGDSSRQLSRQPIKDLEASVARWDAMVKRLSARRGGTRYVVPA